MRFSGRVYTAIRNVMPRKTSSYAETDKLGQLRDQGWCAFEELYGRTESARLGDALRQLVEGLDDARLAGFGATIFSLAARDPLMRRELRGATVLPFIARALDDLPRLRRTGARISGRTSCKRIVWHHHEGWGARSLAERTAFQRLLFIVYLQGTDREHGPLVVRPRAFDDSLQAPPADLHAAVPGELQLEYPPGTVVVMDAPVLHSALRGTGPNLRMIFGAHCQPKSNDRPHPEDDRHFESVRVGVRFQTFRWGLRDGQRWVEEANRRAVRTGDRY